MFWKKKKKAQAVKTIEITTHIREFLYDSQLGEAEVLAVLLGASPISDEGQDHEEAMSDNRVKKVSHLVPLIHSYAHLLSDGMIQLEKGTEEEGESYPEEFWDMMHKLLEQISMSVTIGVLSQLTELELIKVKAP